MSLALFYDTETTGLPIDAKSEVDEAQPHLVQVAACLMDLDTRDVVASMDVIVRPVHWTIPEHITAIHGISTEQARAVGVPESLALEMLLELAKGRLRIGHNQAFDDRIVRIGLLRHFDRVATHEWGYAPGTGVYCTMTAATPVMRLPASARMVAAGMANQYKPPRLSEAYTHFTGAPLYDAHHAMADVQGCMAVYFALQDMAGGLEGAAC